MRTRYRFVLALVALLALAACGGGSSGEPDAGLGDACPAEKPKVSDDRTCSPEGKECTFGEECCDGSCYKTQSCKCTGGAWICNYTDPCGGKSE